MAGLTLASPSAERRRFSPWRETWRRYRRHKLAVVSAVLLLVLVLAVVFGPFLWRVPINEIDFTAHLEGPSLAHPFGTDSLGRDIFSRVLHGIRVDLTIGVISTYVPMAYGVVLGAYAGYIGGRFDGLVMRVLDVAMAFPFLVLIIVIVAILGPGVQNIYIAIFLVAWTMYARLARAEMMVERSKDYVTAAEYTLMAQTRAANAVERAELEHRLKRVQEKAVRAANVRQP